MAIFIMVAEAAQRKSLLKPGTNSSSGGIYSKDERADSYTALCAALSLARSSSRADKHACSAREVRTSHHPDSSRGQRRIRGKQYPRLLKA